MSLTLIGTPIGNPQDVTLRAFEKIKSSKIIIGEEPKALRRMLVDWGISPRTKELYFLNEQSKIEDVTSLLELCKSNDVSLVSDCGSVNFFDPGAKLVEACFTHGVDILSLPGVSSLTALIPFLHENPKQFEMLGFPPRDKEQRIKFFETLKSKTSSLFIMDTPYRLQKVIEELATHTPSRTCVLGIELTTAHEKIMRGKPKEILKKLQGLDKKQNFIVYVSAKK